MSYYSSMYSDGPYATRINICGTSRREAQVNVHAHGDSNGVTFFVTAEQARELAAAFLEAERELIARGGAHEEPAAALAGSDPVRS